MTQAMTKPFLRDGGGAGEGRGGYHQTCAQMLRVGGEAAVIHNLIHMDSQNTGV